MVMQRTLGKPKLPIRGISDSVRTLNGSASYASPAFIEKFFLQFVSFKRNFRDGKFVYLLTPKGVHEKSRLVYDFI